MLGFAALLLAGSAEAATLEEIQACVAANSPEKTLRQRQTLTVADRRGSERELELDFEWKRYPQDLSKFLLRVTSPPDMRGSSVLVVENKDRANDIFSYLPELGKTRRLNSRSLSSSVFGSDFSYQDIEYLQSLSSGSDQKLLPDTKVSGRSVHVVESRATGEAASPSETVVSYIDAERCVLVRAEIRGSGGKVRKTLSVDPAKVVSRGKIFEITEIRVDDPVKGTHSVLRTESSERDGAIKDAVFTRGALERRGR